MNKVIVSTFIFLFSGALSLAAGQSVKPTYVAGDVASIGEKKLVVTSKTGPVEIILNEKSAFKKVAAGNPPDLTAATTGSFAEISVGDKLTVSALLAEDGKTLTARTVYFITKVDIDAKNAKEAGEWRRRGVNGKITAVNPQTNQLTLETRTATGVASSVVITPKDGAKFLRYAPDSIKFDEALPSSVGETKVGDMMRALGDRSSDGTSFAAEQVVVGAFQTVAGTVKSIDPEKNEVVIKNLQTSKDVTVAISDTSVLKRFPAEQAEMLARLQGMGAGGARPMGPGGARPVGQAGTPGGQPGAGNPGGTPGGQPGQGRPVNGNGGRGGGVEEMLERSPSIKIADLKVGDIIALSSSKTADVSRLKAIKLFAGVEPFLRASQAAGGRRGQGGLDGGFSIPGLDGIGFP